ncbi:MAG: hypothetical protein V4596_12800 [Bdellovibrionota bacterium]
MTIPNFSKNQKGQSSLEAALMALMLVIFIVVFLGTMYLMYSSYWVEHIMYESLICTQERGQKQVCLHEAKQKIKSILFFKEAYEMKLTGSPWGTQATVRMKMHLPLLDPFIFNYVKRLEI